MHFFSISNTMSITPLFLLKFLLSFSFFIVRMTIGSKCPNSIGLLYQIHFFLESSFSWVSQSSLIIRNTLHLSKKYCLRKQRY